MKKPLGYVHEWKMSEEERLAYIEKHPIKPTEKPKEKIDFDFSQDPVKKEKRIKALEKARATKDYKWRSQKGADSRWGEK